MSAVTEAPVRPGIRPRPTRADLAWRDVREGVGAWRIWALLAWNDVLHRYRRSVIGPFWITLSMGVLVLSLGLVYAQLFRISLTGYLPFLAVSIILWNFISTLITEGCMAFVAAEWVIRQTPMPKSVFILRGVLRSLLVFAHNIVIYALVVVAFEVPVGVVTLLAVPALALVAVNGLWVTTVLGFLCTRFRDLPQAVGSLMQLLFFVTPVMWQPAQLPPANRWVVEINPFGALLTIIREPLLGHVPPAGAWIYAVLVTLAGLLVAGLTFVRFRGRLAYWL